MLRPTSLSGLLSSLFVLAAILVFSAHAQERAHSVRPRQERSQSFGAFSYALREVLMERGFDAWEIEQIVFAVAEKLDVQQHAKYLTTAKRTPGWGRISLQTRFAPFGTKLVPDRSNGDSTGPSLLRYGRSSPSESN